MKTGCEITTSFYSPENFYTAQGLSEILFHDLYAKTYHEQPEQNPFNFPVPTLRFQYPIHERTFSIRISNSHYLIPLRAFSLSLLKTLIRFPITFFSLPQTQSEDVPRVTAFNKTVRGDLINTATNLVSAENSET